MASAKELKTPLNSYLALLCINSSSSGHLRHKSAFSGRKQRLCAKNRASYPKLVVLDTIESHKNVFEA